MFIILSRLNKTQFCLSGADLESSVVSVRVKLINLKFAIGERMMQSNMQVPAKCQKSWNTNSKTFIMIVHLLYKIAIVTPFHLMTTRHLTLRTLAVHGTVRTGFAE